MVEPLLGQVSRTERSVTLEFDPDKLCVIGGFFEHDEPDFCT